MLEYEAMLKFQAVSDLVSAYPGEVDTGSPIRICAKDKMSFPGEPQCRAES